MLRIWASLHGAELELGANSKRQAEVVVALLDSLEKGAARAEGAGQCNGASQNTRLEGRAGAEVTEDNGLLTLDGARVEVDGIEVGEEEALIGKRVDPGHGQLAAGLYQ